MFHVEQTFEAAKTLQIKIEFEMENLLVLFSWQWHEKQKTVTVYICFMCAKFCGIVNNTINFFHGFETVASHCEYDHL